MSRPSSIYAVSIRSSFLFLLHFHYDQLYDFMNTEMVAFVAHSSEYVLSSLKITRVKNMNNFQIAKVHP